MPTKECFGELANMSISYNQNSEKHFLRVDDVKLKECDRCPLFSKCMFVRYNDLFKEMLRMLDDTGAKDARPRIKG